MKWQVNIKPSVTKFVGTYPCNAGVVYDTKKLKIQETIWL